MTVQRHVILRQTIELTIARQEDAWSLQQQVSGLMSTLQAGIAEHCDRLALPQHRYRIDRLELDLGTIDARHLPQEWSEKFGAAFADALAVRIKQLDATEQLGVETHLKLFSYFLRHGYLPWWADSQASPQHSLCYLLNQAGDTLSRDIPALLAQPQQLQRLIAQFNDDLLVRLFIAIYPGRSDLAPALLDVLQGLTDDDSPALLAQPQQLQRLIAQFNDDLLTRLFVAIYPGRSDLAPALLDVLQGLTDAAGFVQAVLRHLALSLNRPLPDIIRSVHVCAETRHPLLATLLAPLLAAEPAFGPNPAAALDALRAKLTASGLPEALRSALADWLRVLDQQGGPQQSFNQALMRLIKALWAYLNERSFANDTYGNTARPDASKPAVSHKLNQAWTQTPSTLETHDENLATLLNLLFPAPATPLQSKDWLQALLVSHSDEDKTKEASQPLLTALESPPSPLEIDAENLATLLAELFPAVVAQPHSENEITEFTDFDEAEGIYVSNAGLVLLWPFLAALFARLEFLRPEQTLAPESSHRAIAVLHYLAYGERQVPEQQAALNKCLCSMAQHIVLEPETPLTDAEAEECDNLLTALLSQVPELTALGPVGLRHLFLQRQGVLQRQDEHWLLRVEAADHDQRLAQLSWSVSWVKLPWMATILRVEW